MTLLLETVVEEAPYAFSLTSVGIIGFIAAVTIGSIAWYNSKRPVGWEDKEKPDIVPDVKK
ncbi:hypothetical protein S7335_4647 [Synechococcus sp. PCC 7335]|uniref:photosystem II assembly protein Psb35 n=1 Tax=Synechococcus sp. (strain ATCC 29403 / PCC 7335) TaxID=91464 RepID=UPI00017EBFA2|nr:hypothetical protein [Synechococcus sp. PCC 7335]EDX86940.1 hypothetical protein S7335_4647 [Synechococcus sp. PCC 7335]